MTSRALRRRAVASLAAVLVVAFVFACLAGGSLYRWCVPMGRVMESCCCQHVSDDDELLQGAPVARKACCESRQVGSLPVTSAQAGVQIPVAQLALAVEPPPIVVASGPRPELWVGALAARGPPVARPPPRRRAGQRLSALQIYRC